MKQVSPPGMKKPHPPSPNPRPGPRVPLSLASYGVHTSLGAVSIPPRNELGVSELLSSS
jgi:hypothetical protein